MVIPTLETERLLLRPWRDSDLDAYVAMLSHPDVARFMGGEPAREDAWRHMASLVGHWELRGYGMWALEAKESGEFLGRAGPWYPEGWPGFEVGWTLAREHWGHGYATEAALASLHFAFGELGRDHVISLIDPQNERSIRVAERIGERHERNGELDGRPVRIYGIDRETFSGFSPD